MQALMLHSPRNLVLEHISVPEPGPDELLIKVAYVGICGSDLPRYRDGKVHSFPQILGHEFCGYVAKGSSDGKLKLGSPVVVVPLMPCFACQPCKRGDYGLCEKYGFLGSRQPGGLSEYVVAPKRNCLPLPLDMDLKLAALIEPLTVAIHAVNKARLNVKDKALILGCGSIGLLLVAALKAKGFKDIVCVDLDDSRLALAKEIGASAVVNAKDAEEQDFAVNLVFESAGSPVTQRLSIKYAAKSAQIVFVGTATKKLELEPEVFELILRKELALYGSWMSYSKPFPGQEWQDAISYLSQRVIKIDGLIGGVYSLAQMQQGFEDVLSQKAIKVLCKLEGSI